MYINGIVKEEGFSCGWSKKINKKKIIMVI